MELVKREYQFILPPKSVFMAPVVRKVFRLWYHFHGLYVTPAPPIRIWSFYRGGSCHFGEINPSRVQEDCKALSAEIIQEALQVAKSEIPEIRHRAYDDFLVELEAEARRSNFRGADRLDMSPSADSPFVQTTTRIFGRNRNSL